VTPPCIPIPRHNHVLTLQFKLFIMWFFFFFPENVYRIFCLWVILYWKVTSSFVTEFCFFKHLLCDNLCEHIYRAKIPVPWKYIPCCLFPKMWIWHIFHQIFSLVHNWKLSPPPPHFSLYDSSESDKLSVTLWKYSDFFAHDWCLLYHITDLVHRHEEIKSRSYAGNICYHLVQKLLSCQILCKKYKIKILKTIILPVVIWVGNLVFL